MAQFISRQQTNNIGAESLIFFGTGEVSLNSLLALSKIYPIEAVFTKPNYINHGKSHSSPVKTWATSKAIPVYQPATSHNLISTFDNQGFSSRFGVVVDYGMIIPADIINIFEKGIINSHFSLLPQWRGADPITFSILSGQDETGVSLMKIDEGLDTGYLIAQEKLKTKPDEDSAALTKRLIKLSNSMLGSHLPNYLNGLVEPVAQSGTPSFSRKLTKSDGKINWNKPAMQLEREIRAYKTWPKSYCQIDNTRVVITSASVSQGSLPTQPSGTIQVVDGALGISCGNNSLLVISTLKPDGKKEMTSQAFLVGRPDLKKKLIAG